MGKLASLDGLATFFVLVGAFNWGLIGIFDFNLITALLGSGVATQAIYVLVGFFAVYVGYTSFCKK